MRILLLSHPSNIGQPHSSNLLLLNLILFRYKKPHIYFGTKPHVHVTPQSEIIEKALMFICIDYERKQVFKGTLSNNLNNSERKQIVYIQQIEKRLYEDGPSKRNHRIQNSNA